MKIDTEVLQVLSTAAIDGDGVRLDGQLDRKLYVKVAKVLEAGGAKWHRKSGMHVFGLGVVSDRIEQAILTGQITTHQDIDYFPTPDAVIDVMLDRADVRPEHDVLEPSAGRGAIALRIQKAGARRLVCVEYDATNMRILRMALGVDALADARGEFTFEGSFTQMRPHAEGLGTFDRILMNPPFSSQSDISHIRHAFNFLKPGGRIVAIASAGVQFRQDKKTMDFAKWLGERGAEIEELPAGSFKSSGTGVNTVMITIDKGSDSQ